MCRRCAHAQFRGVTASTSIAATTTAAATTGGTLLRSWLSSLAHSPGSVTQPPYTGPPPVNDGKFTDTLLLGGFTLPTDVAFAPDGRMFVTEKPVRDLLHSIGIHTRLTHTTIW